MAKVKKSTVLKRRESTKDFRKKTGRDTVEKMLEEARLQLLDEKGDIKKELLRDVVCEVCGTRPTRSTFLFRKDAFEYHKCKKCSLLYMHPQLIEEKVVEHYKEDAAVDAWVDVLTSSSQFSYDSVKFDTRLAAMEKYVQPGNLLDIGCSIGHFLKVGKERGWKPYGLEFNDRAVAYAKEKFKIRTIQKVMLDEAGYPDNYFSGIGLWGVLEHLARPREILREMKRILTPGGVVVISVPSAGSLAVRVIRQLASCFNGVGGHLWFSSAETLPRLLEEEGYEILEVGSEQPELDTVWNYLNFEHPYEGNARFPFGEAARNIVERFILEHTYGYKLVVLARKPTGSHAEKKKNGSTE